jgi:hypothetical protein
MIREDVVRCEGLEAFTSGAAAAETPARSCAVPMTDYDGDLGAP